MNIKRVLKYHLRWQTGFLYTYPVMYLFIDVWNMPMWLTILAFQFIGALIYYPLDKYIFKK